MVPLSIRYARNASQAPPSGSSPTQHGHGELQEHASRSEPWTRYFALVAIDGPPSFDRCARITAAAYAVARGRGRDPEACSRRRQVGHGPGTGAWKYCPPLERRDSTAALRGPSRPATGLTHARPGRIYEALPGSPAFRGPVVAQRTF